MDEAAVFAILLVLALAVIAFVLPIVALVKASNARRTSERLETLLRQLQSEVSGLKHAIRTGAAAATPPPAPAPAAQPARPAPTEVVAAPAHAPEPTPVPRPVPLAPPPLPATTAARPEPVEVQFPEPALDVPPPVVPPEEVPPPKPAFNLEQFVGVKLFAWIGAIAFVLGAIYFLKLSIERGWIPPEVRVAMGFVAGAGLIVGGLFAAGRRYVAAGQSLCAAGILTLYAVTFACRALYHFPFFGVIPTFALMALITTAAFVLAVRMPAQVVAVLGLVGGFLTPVLLSTGVDNPLGLFGYLALLDIGLLAVALHRRWHYLTVLAVLGTALLQAGWAEKFFAAEKLTTAVAVCALFVVLFTAAVAVARKLRNCSDWLAGAACVPAVVAFFFSLWFTTMPAVAAQPGWVLGNVLLADLALLAIAALHPSLVRIHLFAGLVALAVSAIWIARAATTALLPWALGFVFVFAALHAVFPFVLRRFNPEADDTRWSGLFGPLGIIVLMIPVAKLGDVGWLLWPAVLLLDLIALAAAAITGRLAVLAGAVVLTLITLGLAIVNIPTTSVGGGFELVLVAAFAVLFVAGSVWIVLRLALRPDDDKSTVGGAEPTWLLQLPGASAAMPFALLVLLVLRLRLDDPSAVFGVALLLIALLFGLAAVARQGLLVAAAFVGTLAVEYAWFGERFAPANAGIGLAWFAGFAALFLVFPFATRRQLLEEHLPWAVAALSLPAHFFLLHRAVPVVWPNDMPGALAALCALPPLVGLTLLLRWIPSDAPFRLNRLAWFGAVTLFFITLVFPLQFSKHWITIGWSLEGAALLWLFHRVPHPGLRVAGVGLLVAVFVRLIFNPEVFDYAARGERPILNWILWTYGLAAICSFVGARLLAPPRDRVLGQPAPAILATLGTVLTFALVNLEIADYFTPIDERLRIEFSGNFARDMSYTIAWAVFAFVLLVIGISKRLRAARYAAIALLAVTLAKLFFHDLARLENVYRIAALMAVAVVVLAASFLYQRFLSPPEKKP